MGIEVIAEPWQRVEVRDMVIHLHQKLNLIA